MKRALLALVGSIFTITQIEAQELDLFKGDDKLTSKWIAEDQSAEMSATLRGDTVEVIAPKGLTIWYDMKMKGDYEIRYRVKMVMEGGKSDRLSDLNCFWGASDPLYPKDLFARSESRGGSFGNYNALDLFYVGYGGNNNTSTRFRRYFGEFAESAPEKNRPVVKEYDQSEDLLKPNEWMDIVIRVEGGRTTYSVDGKELFNHPVEKGQERGYFGFRLLRNHTIFTDFRVTKL
ncbi:MAG: DUF6250 domain-containing protein [Rikenellaceae bacterium]